MTKTNSPTLDPNVLASRYGLDQSPAEEAAATTENAPRRWIGKVVLVGVGAVLAVPTTHILARDVKDSYNYGYHPSPAGQVHKN